MAQGLLQVQDLQHPTQFEQLQGLREGNILQGLLRRQAAALRTEPQRARERNETTCLNCVCYL